MTRWTLMPACLVVTISCGAGTPVEPRSPLPPYVLSGIVEGVAGIPLRGALVQLFVPGPMPPDSTITGPDGYFSFSGLRGQVLITVTRSGYATESRSFTMTQDLLSNTIRLAPWLETETLTFGEWIESRVFVGAPPCDPWGWDAEAPCRKFLFEAPMDGRLVVTLEWTGDPQLDATLVTPSGGYLGISHEAGYERALLEGPVLRSRAYEVRVNSYYGTQDFRLKAELIP